LENVGPKLSFGQIYNVMCPQCNTVYIIILSYYREKLSGNNISSVIPSSIAFLGTT